MAKGCSGILQYGFGLGEVAVFEKLKMNNIMKLVSDTQLKLQGQAAILPNPLLYEVPSCDVRLPIEKLKLGVFVFAKLRSIKNVKYEREYYL